MEVYRIAGMNIAVNTRYEITREYMRNFLTDNGDYELLINVDDDMIEHEKRLNYEIHGYEADKSLGEIVAILRVLCDYIIHRQGFFLHCSCLKYRGGAMIFTAPSGTGKSTHSALWRRHFGSEVEMINDDKPLVREVDGEFVIFGTPWNGKHNIGNNISAPIRAVYFLEQAPENSAERVDAFTALSLLLQQTIAPTEREDMSALLDMLGRLIENVPMFRLRCTISDEAVTTAVEAFESAEA